MHAPKRRGEKTGKISKRPLAPWIHESRQPRMYSTRTSRRGIGKQSESAQDSTTCPSQLECVRPGFQKRPCESRQDPRDSFDFCFDLRRAFSKAWPTRADLLGYKSRHVCSRSLRSLPKSSSNRTTTSSGMPKPAIFSEKLYVILPRDDGSFVH